MSFSGNIPLGPNRGMIYCWGKICMLWNFGLRGCWSLWLVSLSWERSIWMQAYTVVVQYAIEAKAILYWQEFEKRGPYISQCIILDQSCWRFSSDWVCDVQKGMSEEEARTCPVCSERLILKPSHSGGFIACSAHPACTYARPMTCLKAPEDPLAQDLHSGAHTYDLLHSYGMETTFFTCHLSSVQSIAFQYFKSSTPACFVVGAYLYLYISD